MLLNAPSNGHNLTLNRIEISLKFLSIFIHGYSEIYAISADRHRLGSSCHATALNLYLGAKMIFAKQRSNSSKKTLTLTSYHSYGCMRKRLRLHMER
jgi:hypothetical protein